MATSAFGIEDSEIEKGMRLNHLKSEAAIKRLTMREARQAKKTSRASDKWARTHTTPTDGAGRETGFPIKKSAFGVEDDRISKADGDAPRAASGGRQVTAYFLPGLHGAVAGKKGRKLRATGTELGSSVGGGIAGGAIGGAVGGIRGEQIGRTVGAVTGSVMGVNHNQGRNYKPQGKKS